MLESKLGPLGVLSYVGSREDVLDGLRDLGSDPVTLDQTDGIEALGISQRP